MTLRDEVPSRFANHNQPVPEKAAEREEIDRKTDEFLASGKSIQKIEPGVTALEPTPYFQIHGKHDLVIQIKGRKHPGRKK